MDRYKVQIEHDLSNIIHDIITTAIEGGIHHWCGEFEVMHSDVLDGGSWWSNQEFLLQNNFIVRFHDIETSDFWDLSPKSFIENLSKVPNHIMNRIIDESYDADDADALVQVLLFGEITFS